MAPPFAGAEEVLSDKQFAIECRAIQRGKSSFIKCQVIFQASPVPVGHLSYEQTTTRNNNNFTYSS